MTTPGQTDATRAWIAISLLWLAGTGLRLTILAVPPVIPMIHDDLHLTETEVGILTGLPSLLFGLAAVPGSLLVARLGTTSALVTGLALTAVGGALRGGFADTAWLYATTILMSAGVAIMQVTMPPAVRAWQPQRIAFTTAVYTNGLIVGEILPVALMIPVILPLVHNSWALGFAAWSLPVAATALLIMLFAPKAQQTVAAAPRRKWWPDWRDGLIWRLGIMLGTINAIYFTTNAFLPDYLHRSGAAELISPSLTALNVGQLPASLLLLVFAHRLERKVWPYVTAGVLSMLGVGMVVFGSGISIVAGSALIGFSASSILILVLALPPLLSAPDDVHRVTAAMFTISYTCAVLTPICSGLLWDLTGAPQTAFIPIVACGIILIVLSPAIGRVRPAGEAAAVPR